MKKSRNLMKIKRKGRKVSPQRAQSFTNGAKAYKIKPLRGGNEVVNNE
jgi:hypothetical protein